MPAKIMFFFYLLLIITFSNFALCIQNGLEPDDQQRNQRTSNQFLPEDGRLSLIEPRRNYAQQSYPGQDEDKFVFPNEYHDNVNNDLNKPTEDYANTATIQLQTGRQRPNPYNGPFNTGEHYLSSTGHSRPISNYPNRLFGSNGNHGDVPNYRDYDNPNYFQNNYAQNYNYPGYKRPNYNRRPTPPPRPPPPSYDYPYQLQGERPYRIQRPTQSQYDVPSYAGLFNNFQPFSNPLMKLFGNFGGQPSNPVGDRLNKALADISENDDLNCVPKLLCQMIGNPERRAELPSFLTAPAINSLIAALPSTSPALVFGRAALLGFTGGEDSCDTTYSKCPRNEDDLLYYLNNHRGGFFRFFNGGDSFSDVSGNFYNPHSQYGGNQQYEQHQGDLQSSSGGTNSGGFNLASLGSNLGLLSNLASLVMPAASQNSDGQTGGLGAVVGNLLTGLVGGRSQSRKLSRRISEGNTTIDEDHFLESNTTSIKVDGVIEDLNSAEKISENEESKRDERVEGRILNSQNQIYSDLYNDDRNVKFPFDSDNYVDKFRDGKKVAFEDSGNQEPNYMRFEPDNEPIRTGKKISFHDDLNQNSNYSPTTQAYRFPQDEIPLRTKMIFPDRTGTGNLRFDNADFDHDRNRDRDRDRDRDSYSTRYGKILNRPSYSGNNRYQNNNNYDDYYPTRRPSYYANSDRYDYTTTRRPYYPNYNRYETTTRRPTYSNDYYGTSQVNRYTPSRPQGGEGNVYVTNSKGEVDYYIKPSGQKVYL